MVTAQTPVVAAIVLVSFGILGWGFFRAKGFGKLGILAWLQSVVLMVPWLLFFGLFAAGIYVNLAGILLLIVVSTTVYIAIGKKLRELGQDAILRQKANQRIASETRSESSSSELESSTSESSTSEQKIPELQPEIIPIPEEDLNVIKGIFGIDTFFSTQTIAYQEGAIFRGNIRGEPEVVHERLSANLKKSLGDKYRLFLVENTDGKPVVIILPSRNEPRSMTLAQKIFGVILFFATIATSMEAAGILLSFDFFASPERYQETLVIAGGIIAILISHEIGHWFFARRYDVRLSLPYFIPAVQIGSFGSITRFESILPSRKVLFDIALAGPATSGIVSLVLLIVGFLLSQQGSYFELPNQFFQGSILVGTLAKVILGSALESPLVGVHPLVIIGWLGLVITALNLMPAGQLDGGRIVQAIYGRKTAQRTTIVTLIVLGLVSLGNPLAIYWAIVILFLQRDLERPSLNEITEPDDARAALGLLALFLMITTLIPLAPALAGSLGIGN